MTGTKSRVTPIRTIGILVIVVAASACGDGGGDSSDTTSASESETTSGSLIPLEEAQAAQDAVKTIYGTTDGDPVKIDAITFAVSGTGDPVDQDGTRALPVYVRVENPSSESIEAPDVELFCAEDDTPHYYVSGSTYPPDNRTMPSGTFTEGTILMEYPAGCIDAYIEVSPLISTDRTPIVRFLIDETATPPTAPSTTMADVKGDIETPAEAAAALVAAGIACDRFLDAPPGDLIDLGPPTLDGSCENGDLKITIAVFEGDAGSTMDALLPSFSELFKSYGITEFAAVTDGQVSYGAEPIDGSFQTAPSDADLELLTQIADATGGELKTYEF